MKRQRIHAAVWSVVGAGGLLLAGCSGDSDEPASGNTTGQPSNDEQSPLSEYMGEAFSQGIGRGGMAIALGPGSDENSDEEARKFRQVQELIAECMREEGFEYVPESLEDLAGPRADVEEAYALEPEEFARTYGYGVATLMGVAEDEETPDPNKEIRDSLSDSARKAYDQAFWGDMAAVLDSDGTGDVMTTPGELENMDQGCQGSAFEEVYEVDSGAVMRSDSGDFDGLFQDIWTLRDRIDRDPRVVAATEEWQHCMADAGHPDFETPEDPVTAVFDRLGQLQSSGDDTEEQSSSVTVGVVPGGAADIDPEALRELQEFEIDLATTDYSCRQEHYEEVYRDVAFDMEQEFVDANQAELERYRDWVAQSGGFG